MEKYCGNVTDFLRNKTEELFPSTDAVKKKKKKPWLVGEERSNNTSMSSYLTGLEVT